MQTKILTGTIPFIAITILTTLRFASAEPMPGTKLTELGSIIFPALHCIYCNPGFYPHGILWYLIMIPIVYPFSSTYPIMIVIASIDMGIMFLIKNHPVFWPYFICSFISFFVIPQNIPVLWVMLLGLKHPILLGLSIETKLPVGAPKPVWDFIFHTSLNIVTNFQWDYGVLVGLWLFILLFDFRFQMIKGYQAWMRMKH